MVKTESFFKKIGHYRPLIRFFVFSNKQFLQQIDVKNVHKVYGAGIRTHDLWNMSLIP